MISAAAIVLVVAASQAITVNAINFGNIRNQGVESATSKNSLGVVQTRQAAEGPKSAQQQAPESVKYASTNHVMMSCNLINTVTMIRSAMLQIGSRSFVTSIEDTSDQQQFSTERSSNEQQFNPFGSSLAGSDRSDYGIFPGQRTLADDGDEGFNFFHAATPADWYILLGVSIVLILLDIMVLRQAPSTFRWHLAMVFLWVSTAIAYNMLIWGRMTYHKAFEWCSGYILEWMLSMDNLFVFHLIFQGYQTPENQIHKAVFIGIIGALIMRMLFFMLVSTLLHIFSWFRWPFGILLVWSGIQAARNNDNDEQGDIEDTKLVIALKWILGNRLFESYAPDASMFVRDSNGRLQATMLIVVVICLEITDILFALDSVSAKVAQIPDQYIAFSSSVFAMFGLRAMFFIVNDLVNMFDMLQYGLCIILVFIGLELMFSKIIHLASSTVCIMILAVFAVCILGSHVKTRITSVIHNTSAIHNSDKHDAK